MGVEVSGNTSSPEFPSGVAVVIGGSGGVGRAICKRLAQSGADVLLTYRGNREAAEAAANDVRSFGRTADITALTIEDAAGVKAMIDGAAAKYKRIHTVVYAAGPHVPQIYVSQIEPDQWRKIIDTDVNGFFNVVHAARPHLCAQGGGSLVVISTAGLTRYPPRDALSIAPKGAVEALMRAVAREEGRHGFRANAVALGVIEAGMFHRLKDTEYTPEFVEIMRNNIAMKRFGKPEEVAEAAVFFASSRSSYITGQTLTIDGGYTL